MGKYLFASVGVQKMPRKPQRRRMHYSTSGYGDGAVTTCIPIRKPLPKRIKEDCIYIDADFVCREIRHSPHQFPRWELEQRIRFSDILANRLNTRRAIREIAMPVLTEIQASLRELNERLKRIEDSLKA